MSKIKEITIKNYKSIKEMQLELNKDLNVFVGANNSGKTNILDCIFEGVNLQSDLNNFRSISRLQNYDQKLPLVTIITDKKEKFIYNNNVSNKIIYDPERTSTLLNNEAKKKIINSVTTAKVDGFIDINKNTQEMQNFFKNLKEEEIPMFLSNINNDLLIISNDFYSVSVTNDNIFVADSFGDTAPIEEKSSGVKKMVFMSYFLNKFHLRNKEVPNIVFFDEPETHLHIEAQRYLYKKIKSVFSNSQIIISTHSTAFINDTDLNKIFLVDRTSEIGTYIDFKKKEKKKLLKINEIMGINLFDTLGMDITSSLVMVEGKTDRFYHDYVYHRLYPTKKKNFVEVEGANKITDFISVYKEIYPSRPTGILDYDTKGLNMANKIKNKFNDEFDNKIIMNNNLLIKDIEESKCKPEDEIEVEDLFDFEFLKKCILELLEESELSISEEQQENINKICSESTKFNQIEKKINSLELPSKNLNRFTINKYNLSIKIKGKLEEQEDSQFEISTKKFSDLYIILNKNTGG